MTPARTFLLATLFLALTISPVMGDTPTTPVVPATPSIYDEIRAGKPGALLSLHQVNLKWMLVNGVRAFGTQTGRYPETAEDVIASGLLPFIPMTAAGTPMQIDILEQSALPGPDAIGLRCRGVDTAIIQMGADGDPLSPDIYVSEHRDPPYESWPYDYAWRRRVTVLMRTATVRQFIDALNLTGKFPTSSEALGAATRMLPHGCAWQTTCDPTATGVMVEMDPAGELLRTTCYPDPGSIAVQVHHVTSQGTSRLSKWPYGLVMPIDWQPFGMLVIGEVPDLPHAPAPVVAEGTERVMSRPIRYPSAEITAKEYARLGAWHVDQTGRPPSAKWLLDSGATLHLNLDREGAIIDLQAYQETPAELTTPLNQWESQPEASALGVDQEGARVWLPSEMEWNFPDGVILDPALIRSFTWQSSWSRFSQYQLTGRQKNQTMVDVLSDEAAAAMSALADDPGSAPDSLAWELWESHEALRDDGFSYRYLTLAAESTMRVALRWRSSHPSTPMPSWAQVLGDSQLAPRHYRVLPSGEQPSRGEGLLELALGPDDTIYRVTMRHPNGLRRSWYARVSQYYQMTGDLNGDTGRQAVHTPEFTALDYTSFVTLAIPIPDPPVLPEATP